MEASSANAVHERVGARVVQKKDNVRGSIAADSDSDAIKGAFHDSLEISPTAAADGCFRTNSSVIPGDLNYTQHSPGSPFHSLVGFVIGDAGEPDEFSLPYGVHPQL